MTLRGFSGFGDDRIEAERDMYADWWGQVPGQQLTEQVRPEIQQAEAMQAAAAPGVQFVAQPQTIMAKQPVARAAATKPAMPGLAKRVFLPLLVIGGLGAILMLATSSKKSK